MPSIPTNPYLLAGSVTAQARALINDMSLGTVSGDILSDAQPYTFLLLQGCYEEFQDVLIEHGVESLQRECILLNLTPTVGADPSIQNYVTYSGYYNGSTTVSQPVLPPDMFMPVRLAMRQSGTLNTFGDVGHVMDWISTDPATGYTTKWQWREDKAFFPPFTVAQDARFKYYPMLPQLSGPNSPVQIAGAKMALAYMLAEKACESRNNPALTASFAMKAEKAVKRMCRRTSHKRQRTNYRKKPFRSRMSGRSCY